LPALGQLTDLALCKITVDNKIFYYLIHNYCSILRKKPGTFREQSSPLLLYCFRFNFPVFASCIYLTRKHLPRALPGIFIHDRYIISFRPVRGKLACERLLPPVATDIDAPAVMAAAVPGAVTRSTSAAVPFLSHLRDRSSGWLCSSYLREQPSSCRRCSSPPARNSCRTWSSRCFCLPRSSRSHP